MPQAALLGAAVWLGVCGASPVVNTARCQGPFEGWAPLSHAQGPDDGASLVLAMMLLQLLVCLAAGAEA